MTDLLLRQGPPVAGAAGFGGLGLWDLERPAPELGGGQQGGAAFATEPELHTAVVVSLFTDRRAQPDDRLPDQGQPGEGGGRRGWWGDSYLEPGDLIGSRLWLLVREKQTPETLVRARAYAREALRWLIEDGVAVAVEVEAFWLRRGLLALDVRIRRPGGTAFERRYDLAWEQLEAA